MATQDQRPRFYEEQYLGADDMNAVVEYDHEMIARHEFGSHGWGIAVGLTLVEQPTPGAPKRQNVFLDARNGRGRVRPQARRADARQAARSAVRKDPLCRRRGRSVQEQRHAAGPLREGVDRL